ncbi:MAG: glycosyltransferase family 2 protein, partial [Ktedonobacteraceae bacterium]|nr:glycosyltransferase family 2 protein [Ktedonobacteraceae bacterium]
MRISVVVPVYNEEKTIVQVLTRLAQVSLDLEVIVVDDASKDNTWKIMQQLQQQEAFSSFRFVRHKCNQGKGASLRTGFRLISGDLVTVQDADLEYDPQDLPALVRKWQEITAEGHSR